MIVLVSRVVSMGISSLRYIVSSGIFVFSSFFWIILSHCYAMNGSLSFLRADCFTEPACFIKQLNIPEQPIDIAVHYSVSALLAGIYRQPGHFWGLRRTSRLGRQTGLLHQSWTRAGWSHSLEI
ncbi:uncharacterized protein C8R40DRAFT_745852 [Lentinula edodes]|uniref:uncharacterized protein n=1 Tax=Lentinula edodes TaxID=5353 RepID=UPI001E8E114A|nr:uncharacterized protein C8R40DRAFT_745852 [Lentinula edodes]KAH7869324.1 hypothetical protein C8R40DRAFT_745852 [Lentinula edodes]